MIPKDNAFPAGIFFTCPPEIRVQEFDIDGMQESFSAISAWQREYIFVALCQPLWLASENQKSVQYTEIA